MPLAAGGGGPHDMGVMNVSAAAQHDMTMAQLPSSATSSPNMALHVALREPGIYKLWLQFKGGNELYVAPFVITVS